jgi:hypothetical protein
MADQGNALANHQAFATKKAIKVYDQVYPIVLAQGNPHSQAHAEAQEAADQAYWSVMNSKKRGVWIWVLLSTIVLALLVITALSSITDIFDSSDTPEQTVDPPYSQEKPVSIEVEPTREGYTFGLDDQNTGEEPAPDYDLPTDAWISYSTGDVNYKISPLYPEQDAGIYQNFEGVAPGAIFVDMFEEFDNAATFLDVFHESEVFLENQVVFISDSSEEFTNPNGILGIKTSGCREGSENAKVYIREFAFVHDETVYYFFMMFRTDAWNQYGENTEALVRSGVDSIFDRVVNSISYNEIENGEEMG